MGLLHSPLLNTDGLILHLNAYAKRSYPGTGTTWYDLSGNNNHAMLISGANYSNSNGGIFNFNGVSSYVSTNSIFLSVIHTVSTWFYQGSIPITYNVNALFGEPGSSNTCPIMLDASSINYSMGASGASAPLIYATGTWRHVCTVRNGAIVYFYANGDYLGSNIVPNSITTFTLQKIGARQLANGLYASGSMEDVRIYNRALSSSEIRQIFNSTRRRFGV